ncbi:hypothetical protein GC173_11740 [bacterium]|nr:hypothetical protein [bacterium]
MRKLSTSLAILLVGTAGIAFAEPPDTLHTDFVRVVREWPAGRGPSQTVYVKRATAELRKGPSASDSVVATLKQGEALTVVAAEPARLKVKTATGLEGFITRINVSDSKPSGVSGGQLIVASNTSTTTGANAASIRGLSPMAEKYAKDLKISEDAVEDVKKMEKVGDQISPAQVASFAREGGVVAP